MTFATSALVARGEALLAPRRSRRVRAPRRSTIAPVASASEQSGSSTDDAFGASSSSPSASASTPPRSSRAREGGRSPFPLERFASEGAATSGRFLWASRGVTAGTGLRPLDQRRDWFEQDFFPEDDADRVGRDDRDDPDVSGRDARDDTRERATDREESRWAREMRLRHALIDADDPPCVVWDETASRAAEALLPAMCDWLVERYPERYAREEDSDGVRLTELDGWATGPLERLKGVDALKTCAKLVQEDLCLVKEETLEEAWDAAGASLDDDDDASFFGDDAVVEATDETVPGQTTRHAFRAGVVCFSFDPRKRHGKTLAGLHKPVPGYEARMRRAVSRVFSGLRPEKPLWRANWALQNNAEIVSTALEWHPSNVKMGGVERRARFANAARGTDSTFADEKHVGYMDPLSSLPASAADAGKAMRLRVEYETVTRLPGPRDVSRWILFTVRTHLDALERLDDETCAALLRGIDASDAEELEYKSLGNEALRGAVTAYLASRSGEARAGDSDARRANNAVAGKTTTKRASRCPMSDAISNDGNGSRWKRDDGSGPPDARAAPSAPSKRAAAPSETLFFESGRASVASSLCIDPWLSSAWGVARARAPPASWYASDPAARREAETVFRNGWHFCGRVDQAPSGAPGSYFTANVGGSGASIVVVRGEDDALRAFWNVCRHRAMEVVPDPAAAAARAAEARGAEAGAAGLFRSFAKRDAKTRARAEPSRSERRSPGKGSHASDAAGFETVACDGGVLRDVCMRCPYHGWTYDLAGALVKVPRLSGTERFETRENGLREIAVDVWGPFVWCAFSPADEHDADDASSPAATRVPSVAEWLGAGGEFLSRCGSIPASDGTEPLRFVTKRVYHVDCNWKVFVDNYLDGGYHVPVAHPALAAGVDMKSYETRVEGTTVTQTAPAAETKTAEGKGFSLAGAMDARATRKNRRFRSGGGDDPATYVYVYPNFMVNRYGPWMDTNLVTPTSATTCAVTFEYFLEPAAARDEAFVRDSLAASHAVQMEDIELCEKVQRGMLSPGYEPGRYVALEKGMYHFHRKVWEDLTDDAK